MAGSGDRGTNDVGVVAPSAMMTRPTRRGRWVLRPPFRGASSALVIVIVLGAGIPLTACSSNPRSAAAVCHVWTTQAVPLHDQYAKDSSAGLSLASIIDLVGVPDQLANLMGSMGAVAPEPIEGDFQILQSAFQKEASSMGQAVTDPLGALVGGVVNGLSTAGSYTRVNQYIEDNCTGPGTGHPG
jgi:hypothetical protein